MILLCLFAVGKSVLLYDARCIEDLRAMLGNLAIGWEAAQTAAEASEEGTVERGDARPPTRLVAGMD